MKELSRFKNSCKNHLLFLHHTANCIGQYLGEVQAGEEEYRIEFEF